MGFNYFSKMEIDAIGEILNISLGASATAVSTMLSARVDITTPVVNVVERDEFELDKVDPAVAVEITYVEGLEGENVMLLKRHDVKVIVEMLMGMEISDEEFELNEMNISAVCEVMNQMMGASATALSEFLGKVVNISTPISFEVKDEQEFVDKYFTDNQPKVAVLFTLRIADRLESEFFNVMPVKLAKALVEGFLPSEEIIDISKGVQETPAEEAAPTAPVEEAPSGGGGMMSQEEIERMLAGDVAEKVPELEPAPAGGGRMSQEEIERMLAGDVVEEAQVPVPAQTPAPAVAPAAAIPTPAAPVSAAAPVAPAPAVVSAAAPQMVAAPAVNNDVAMMQIQMMQQMMQQMQQMQQAQQQMLETKRQPAEPKTIHVQRPSSTPLKPDNEIILEGEQEENMELIMGVPLEISVEIGRTHKLVRDILDFTKGSLVVLDKLAGEQVDLFVNGQCIAKGDVVVVEDNFGVRITEIMKVNLLSLE